MMNSRHALVVATFGCLMSANASAQTQATCAKGFQPYANRCISQRMADYISCVEASGGNSERISFEVENANAGKTGVGVKGSGSGIVAKGSGSVTVDRATEQALASKFEHTWTEKGMEECRKVLDPPRSPSPHPNKTPNASGNNVNGNQTAGAPNGIAAAAPAPIAPPLTRRIVDDGNTYENLPNKLEVQDPGTIFTHNLVRGMDSSITNGAYAAGNDFEGRGTPPLNDPNDPVMAGIRAAQRQTIYKCPDPCGEHGPYFDSPIEGLPSDLPLAKALHGSSHYIADQLWALIDEGNAIVDTFCAGNDMAVLNKSQMDWQAKIETVVSNLDQRLGDALTKVKAPQWRSSGAKGLNQKGIDICNLILVKIDVLIMYQNQLRGVGD
jgi:hypothetical protein